MDVKNNILLQEIQALNEADDETVAKGIQAIERTYSITVTNLRSTVWYVVEHELNLLGKEVSVDKGLKAFSILVDFDSAVLIELCTKGYIPYKYLVELCGILGISSKSVLFAIWLHMYSEPGLKVEVIDIDVLAKKDGKLMAIEMKTSLSTIACFG